MLVKETPHHLYGHPSEEDNGACDGACMAACLTVMAVALAVGGGGIAVAGHSGYLDGEWTSDTYDMIFLYAGVPMIAAFSLGLTLHDWLAEKIDARFFAKQRQN
jgi:hypothetical protein